MKVYKSVNIPVKCSKSDYEYLKNCNQLSGQVWNICIDIADNYRAENEGKWIDRNTLQKSTKKCVDLHAKGIHHVVHKYLFARDSALKAKEVGRSDVLFPYKKKKYFVTGWDSQCIKVDYERNILLLSKPMTNEKINGKYRKQKPIRCHAKTLPKNIAEVELVYKGKFCLAIKYIEDIEYLQIKSKNSASIDLGEIHAITSIDSCGNAIIITGRLIRSIKQLRNKNQAKLYKRMSNCEKGSKQYNIYLQALNKLKIKSDRQMNNFTHKITRYYLDFCLLNSISTVYYGDLDSATRGTKQNNKGNGFIRQKLSQWNYGQLVLQLHNKLSRYGIKLVKVKEYYTSKKCPSCSHHNKPMKRNYHCESCEYTQHRDIVGAINILNDNGLFDIKYYNNKKYLQIV